MAALSRSVVVMHYCEKGFGLWPDLVIDQGVDLCDLFTACAPIVECSPYSHTTDSCHMPPHTA